MLDPDEWVIVGHDISQESVVKNERISRAKEENDAKEYDINRKKSRAEGELQKVSPPLGVPNPDLFCTVPVQCRRKDSKGRTNHESPGNYLVLAS